LVAASYRLGLARHDAAQFTVFWVAMIVAVVPGMALAVRLAGRGRRPTALLCLVSLDFYAPKLFRTPTMPLYHDEYAHFWQAGDILRHGKLFDTNTLVTAANQYPGLHIVTAWLTASTGMGQWTTGQVVVGLAHVTAMLGVAALVRGLGRSEVEATVAAFVYALNPSYMYFDTQFSYESLAVAFIPWALLSAVRAGLAVDPKERRLAMGVALALIATVTVTHHLSTLALAGFLSLLALTAAIGGRIGQRHGEHARKKFTGTGLRPGSIAMLAAAAWVIFLAWCLTYATETLAYLGPFPRAAATELWNTLSGGHGGGGASLHPFAQSPLPLYERAAGFGATLLVGVVTLVHLRRRWTAGPTAQFVGVLSLLYCASVPFILTPMGNEGARRSWAFTYIGVAAVLAWAAAEFTVRSKARWMAVTLAGVLLLVGNVASGLNEYYRFPGPTTYGSDARDANQDSMALARWMTAHLVEGTPVIADRYTGMTLLAYGHVQLAVPSADFPTWGLFFSTGTPDRATAQALSDSAFRYIVVDRRMAQNLPALGIYVAPDEPSAGARMTPVPPKAVHKFYQQPWSTVIYDDGRYFVAHLDATMLLRMAR
jgi:hypothetical protein